MMQIRTQQEFSKMVAALFGVVIKNNYPGTEDGIDIGSYSRGTNTDMHPDIDLLFLKIPHDPQQGFVDWTKLDTFEMVHTWDGITDLQQIRTLDPVLFTTITQVLQQLQTIGANSQFCSVRAWRGDPGVVFTLSTQHPVYGLIEFDITLHYPKEHFSAEHARSFHHYLHTVAQRYGEDRALQLLEDIRRLKSAVKAEASPNGHIDRIKKVPGFIIEALFVHQQEPLTYDEVITSLWQHEWPGDERPELPERIQDQEEQLIGTNRSLNDILRSVTRGGYTTLKTVASKEFEHMSDLSRQ